MRIITQSEIDRFVEYRMRNPPRQTGKVGIKIGIPDVLHFYGRKDSELISIVQMTGCLFSMIENNYEDFTLGKSSFQMDGVWFAHENILNKKFPWSVDYGIEEIDS